jgi:uncharacterized SAM-binding protein YcdF (DUF218 family)
MSIFLSKFLPLFLYPLGLLTILLVAVLTLWKKPRLAKTILIAALIILFLGGNRYVASAVARSLEWQYLPQEITTPVDSIVILGGGTEPAIDPRQSVEVNAAGDRVVYGAILANQFPGATVIVSGGDIDFLDLASSSPAEDMVDLLALMGIPDENVLIQGESQNTYEDALYTCAMLKENSLQNTLLVTSATHMPRSVAVFQKQGCEVIAAPTDFIVTKAAWQKLWHPNVEEFLINLIPSYSNLSTLTKSMKEYFGLWVYRIQGYL